MTSILIQYYSICLHSTKLFFGRIILVSLILSCPDSFSLRAQPNSNSLNKFKAVYIYNFLQFIEWPEQVFSKDKHELVIGVVGNPSFADILEQTIKGETINDRSVIVKRLSIEEEIKDCQLVFISGNEVSQLQNILNQNRGEPIVTIGEAMGFADAGGCINFFLEKNKLRFEINVEVMKKARLTISSKLLRLAKIVGKEN